jgi:hypothetical protein
MAVWLLNQTSAPFKVERLAMAFSAFIAGTPQARLLQVSR